MKRNFRENIAGRYTYLTPKAEKKGVFDIPLYVFWGFWALIMGTAAISLAAQGDISSGVISLGIAALNIWGVISVYNRRKKRKDAALINTRLLGIVEDELPFENLRQQLDMEHAEKRVGTLLDQGYLCHLFLDRNKRMLIMTLPNLEVEKEALIKVFCASCGAENLIRRGRVNRCEYCDQTLIIPAGRVDAGESIH